MLGRFTNTTFKDPPVATIDVVVNKKYGGFHIDTEMALWLIENYSYSVTSDPNEQADLLEVGYDYFVPHNDWLGDLDSVHFRSHPDIVCCVATLKDLHKDDEYPEKQYGHIHSLEIRRMKIYLEIEDHNDGIETVSARLEEGRYGEEEDC